MSSERLRVDAVNDEGEGVELRFRGTEVLTAEDGTALYLADGDDVVIIVQDDGALSSLPRADVTVDDLSSIFLDDEDYAIACKALGLERVPGS
jgi:uncharacterized Zn ribbon protein